MRERYTDDEIILMYKNAYEQLDRVKLLSELSNQPKDYIIKLLKKHGIKVENESKEARNKKKIAKFLELYHKGERDEDIAQALEVSASTIYNWRKANGNLPINKKTALLEQKRLSHKGL